MAKPEARWSIKLAQTDAVDPEATLTDPNADPTVEDNAGPDLPLLETDQFVLDTLQAYALANLITFELIPEQYGQTTPPLNILMQLRKALLGMNIAKSKDPKVTRVLSGFTLDPPGGADMSNIQAYGSGTIKPRNFQEGILDVLKSFYQIEPQVEADIIEFANNGPALAITGKAFMESQQVFKNTVKQKEIQLNQRIKRPQMQRTRAINNRTILTAQEAAGPLAAGRYESLNQLIEDLTALGPKPETYEKFMSMVGPEKEDDAKAELANFFQGMISGLFGIHSLLVSVGMANPIDADIVEKIMNQHPELAQNIPERQASLKKKAGVITLESSDFGTYLLKNDDGRDILIQTDWDFPGVASTFGWQACECGQTDGTVDCPHKKASQMIQEAGEYLDEHIGDMVEDPGYFGEPEPKTNMLPTASTKGLFLPAPDSGLGTKVAQTSSYPAYMSHGPGENKYCPKIRKMVNSQICRYHCLDGLAIDDNQILCAEAIWRQSVMDKFSREYRNEDGKWVGGYINKRFEVQYDDGGHPALLKPGTRMAPIEEDAWSLEKRLVEMRRAESKNRGYNTTGDAKGLYNFDQHELMKGPQNKLFEKKKDPIAKIAMTESMFEKTAQYQDPGPITGNPALFDKPAVEDLGPEEPNLREQPEPGDITTSDRENWLKDGKVFFKGNTYALKEALKSSGDEFMPRVWFISPEGPQAINIWEVGASTWSLTKEAKKDKPKYTKTVSEDKFVSCKEQVRENSPDLPENAEYGICTKQLGGQPASYHKKKDKKEDKEANTGWSLKKEALLPGPDSSSVAFNVASPGEKVGAVCTKCGKRFGPELVQGNPCPACKAPVRDLSRGEQTEATGAIPKVQSVTNANIKLANGVYCASKSGVSTYGDTPEEALHKLALKPLMPQAPMDMSSVAEESQQILDQQKAVDEQEASAGGYGGWSLPETIPLPEEKVLPSKHRNLNTPEGLLQELTEGDNKGIMDPTPSTPEIPAEALGKPKVEEIQGGKSEFAPGIEVASVGQTKAGPVEIERGAVSPEVLNKEIQQTKPEIRQKLDEEARSLGAE